MRERETIFQKIQMLGLLGCILMLVVAGNTHATPILIDSFNTDFMQVEAPPTGTFDGSTGSAIGGHRKLEIVSVAGGTAGQLEATINTDAGDLNKLTYNHDSGVSSSASVTWDADDVVDGLDDEDLTDGGLNSILEFKLLGIDFGFIDIEFIFTDKDGNMVSKFLSDLGVGIHQIPFMDFTGDDEFFDGGTGEGFEHINFIVMELTAEAGKDMSMDFVQTAPDPIPEPGTFILFSLAGLCTLGYVWRRRKQVS